MLHSKINFCCPKKFGNEPAYRDISLCILSVPFEGALLLLYRIILFPTQLCEELTCVARGDFSLGFMGKCIARPIFTSPYSSIFMEMELVPFQIHNHNHWNRFWNLETYSFVTQHCWGDCVSRPDCQCMVENPLLMKC